MQQLSAFLGFIAIIFIFSAVTTLFKNKDEAGPLKSRLKYSFIMVVIAALTFGTKVFIVDNEAEIHDSEYRTIYLMSNEVGRDDFNIQVKHALSDDKITKNEYKKITSEVDTSFMKLETNDSLNLSKDELTPLKLKPLEKTSVSLASGVGESVLFMGLIIAFFLLIMAFIKFTSPSQDQESSLNTKLEDSTPDKDSVNEQLGDQTLKPKLTISFNKRPRKGFLGAAIILGLLTFVVLRMNAVNGNEYKAEIDQYFEANSHIEAVQDLKNKIYANGNISMGEVTDIFDLSNAIEKQEIIKSLKK